MNTPSSPRDHWDKNIPPDELFEETRQRLSDNLQLAAMELLLHLNVSAFRMRLGGHAHGFYLTIGGGRHTDEPAPGDDAAHAPLNNPPSLARQARMARRAKQANRQAAQRHLEFDADS